MKMMGKHIRGTSALLSCLLFLSCAVIAQANSVVTSGGKITSQEAATQSDPLTGKYEGTAKSSTIGDMAVTLELLNKAGKLSGKLESSHGVGTIKEGTYDAGKISIKFDFSGDEGTITGQLKGDAITGEWSVGGAGGGLELKRVATAAKTSPAAGTAAAADPISGEWDAAADANGEAVPFVLKLKLDGENVTAESSSQLGQSTGKGSWKNGTLTVKLDGQNGAVMLVATMKEGKLTGDFDYAGQLQGKWVAVKK
jgi:hypothetical protein